MKKLSLLLALLLLLLCGCQENVPDQTTQCTTHIDLNSDGICDGCHISVIVTVDLYSINDLHGKLADAATHPGVDELTTYLKNARQTDEHVILLSAGDMWQGSAESNMTHGRILTDWMNRMDFAAMTMGNHEFDWGEAPIEENFAMAEFPFLAINIYDRQTNERVEYCQPSVLVEAGQAQIGIIGAIGDCYSSIAPDKVEGVYFKTGRDLTELVKAESDRLRREGADFIVYVLHDGYGDSTLGDAAQMSSSRLSSYYDTALSAGYVDLVFEGHTHQRYLIQDEHGVYHLQNRGDNRGISHVEVDVNIAGGESTVQVRELVATGVYENLQDDPLVQELLDKYADEIAQANQVVGWNAVRRGRDEMRQYVADLYYQAGLEKWGEEYNIVLGGGFTSIRSPGYLAAGNVTYGMLQSLFPFDNELVLCSIKGRDLQNKFFRTSNSNYFISYGDYGEQVKNNIDPNGTYYVIVDSYTSSYAPNRLTEVARYGEGIFARDLLADMLERGELAG